MQVKEQGFALAIAVMLLMLLAGMTMFLTRMMSTSQAYVLQNYLVAQAYQAANSGLEWGLYQAISMSPSVCVSEQVVPVVDDFYVEVSCTEANYAGIEDINMFTIQATATHGVLGERDHVVRTMKVTVADKQ